MACLRPLTWASSEGQSSCTLLSRQFSSSRSSTEDYLTTPRLTLLKSLPLQTKLMPATKKLKVWMSRQSRKQSLKTLPCLPLPVCPQLLPSSVVYWLKKLWSSLESTLPWSSGSTSTSSKPFLKEKSTGLPSRADMMIKYWCTDRSYRRNWASWMCSWSELALWAVSTSRHLPWWEWGVQLRARSQSLTMTTLRCPTWTDNSCSERTMWETQSQRLPVPLPRTWIMTSQSWIIKQELDLTPSKCSMTSSGTDWTLLSMQWTTLKPDSMLTQDVCGMRNLS